MKFDREVHFVILSFYDTFVFLPSAYVSNQLVSYQYYTNNNATNLYLSVLSANPFSSLIQNVKLDTGKN